MYRLQNEDFVVRLTDVMWIPRTEENSDYRDCLAWLAEGNELLPAEPLPAPSPAEQIDALEREYMLPRVAREFMLTFMENEAKERAASLGMTEAQALAYLRAQNTGYRKAKELDEQIRALRELL